MTPVVHERSMLANLQCGDGVLIGATPYVVQKVVKGGMGLVLLLEQDHRRAPEQFSVHGLSVALKTILPEFLNDNSSEMFQRELAIWAAFRHPNIVKLNEILDGGRDGLIAAMNRCRGSLRDHISNVKIIPIKEATDIVGDLIDGLSYAYELDRVLHLDLKPENVLYDLDLGLMMRRKRGRESERWRFMLSDWGIASIKQKQLDQMIAAARNNQVFLGTFNNMGTVLYMAPERFLLGYRSSIASDVFSLGMIYFEMLLGELPFTKGGDPIQELLSTSYFGLARMHLQKSSLPRRIQSLILDCIAPQPQNRPSSYSDLRENVVSAYSRIGGWLSKAFK